MRFRTGVRLESLSRTIFAKLTGRMAVVRRKGWGGVLAAAMFEAAVFRANIEESERARGRGEEAGRGKAGGRDDVGTAVFTVAGNKDGRGSCGDGVRLEAWMSALQVKGTTGLSTSESMKDAGTTHPRQTTLTTIGNPPKPLASILKPHPTTSRNPSTFSNLKPNSSAQQKNNKPLRTPTLHPIATVQDNPNSYPQPHRAEPEYRDKELYDRAVCSTSPSSGRISLKARFPTERGGSDSERRMEVKIAMMVVKGRVREWYLRRGKFLDGEGVDG